MCCVYKKLGGKAKGQKTLGEGFKLIYFGTEKKRNGVGIILSDVMKNSVVEVRRISGRIIMVKLMTEEGPLNVISAYAPQAGCSDDEKDEFYVELETLVQRIPQEEKLVVGADLNGHVGKENSGYGDFMEVTDMEHKTRWYTSVGSGRGTGPVYCEHRVHEEGRTQNHIQKRACVQSN